MLRGCLFTLLGLLCLPLWAAAPVRLGVSLPIGDAKTLEARLDTAQTAGIQLVSLRAEWPRVQPAAGKWDFTALDAAVHAVRVRKLEVMLVFGPTPHLGGEISG